MKQIPETRMLEMVRTAVRVAGSQKAFCKEAKISEQYLSDVLNERRNIGAKILKWFDMERVVYYRRRDGGQL